MVGSRYSKKLFAAVLQQEMTPSLGREFNYRSEICSHSKKVYQYAKKSTCYHCYLDVLNGWRIQLWHTYSNIHTRWQLILQWKAETCQSPDFVSQCFDITWRVKNNVLWKTESAMPSSWYYQGRQTCRLNTLVPIRSKVGSKPLNRYNRLRQSAQSRDVWERLAAWWPTTSNQ
jgi:hypothetical protein